MVPGASGMPKAQRARRRPLLGLAALVAIRTVASHGSSCLSFVGPPARGAALRRTRAAAGPSAGRRAAIDGAPAADPDAAPAPPEMSDWDKLYDRFNTRGGVIVGSVIGLFLLVGWNKGLEFILGDSIQAGLYTTGLTFIILLWWTFTYFNRVATKSTTYAQQLAEYEQRVMIRRLMELSDEEILALCGEVGISEGELQEVMKSNGDGNADGKMSNKEKVLAIFKNTPLQVGGSDPRMMV